MGPVDIVALCPPGLEEIVVEAAARELPRCVETVRKSGFVRVRTDATVQQLRAFPCATNLFEVIAEVPRSSIDRELQDVRARLSKTPRPHVRGSGVPRLRIHDDGHFAPTTSVEAVALGAALAACSQPEVSERRTAVDIWLIRRSGVPSSVLARRLTGTGSHRKRGRLRPEVCAALARVEPLAGAQLVMDPFAGSGAIGEACLDAGAKSVWLNDVDPKGARRAERPGLRWTNSDFRKLRVPVQTVDAIVSDPPWGRNWTPRQGIARMYGDLGNAAQAWLRPGGALVLLTGAPDAALELMMEAGNLRPELVLPVLVSGSRARVVRARKGRRRRPA